MAVITRETTSISNQKIYDVSGGAKSTSIDAYIGDPDLLIREYFHSNLHNRSKSRASIASRITTHLSLLEILKSSNQRTVNDNSVYDAAVDLLAEFNNIRLLRESAEYLSYLSAKYLPMRTLENYWSVLLKGISCAYRIPAQDRQKVIQDKSIFAHLISLNRRSIKSTLIDALSILADQDGVDKDLIKAALLKFSSAEEQDLYVRQWANEALIEIG
jgi:hypothetical protein